MEYCQFMNEQQQYSLDKLQELVDYTDVMFSRLAFRVQHRRKKKVLLPLYVNACDIAGSTVILLKEQRVNAATNLVRTLMESYFNARFVYASGSTLWVDSYLLDGENEIKFFTKSVEELKTKYPQLDIDEKGFEEKTIKKFKRRVERFESYFVKTHSQIPVITGVRDRNLLNKNYSIKDRTKIIDHYSKDRDQEGNLLHSEEWSYSLVYGHLSGGTHAGSNFLGSNLLRRDETGVTFSKHGDLASTQLVAYSAYAFLYDLTSLFQAVFECKDRDRMAEFKVVVERLKSEIPG